MKKRELRTKRRAVTSFILIAILVGCIIFLMIYNPKYSPFYKGFDRNFNEVRLTLGQPIIEDYFVPVRSGRVSFGVWKTPDSLRSKVIHRDKNYHVELGEILSESDVYRIDFDSSNYWYVIRHFSFVDSTVEFELIKARDRVVLGDITKIDKHEFDSLVMSWQVFIEKR